MNREIVLPGGAGVYPLTGDVQSQAGSPNVTVVGLQNIPIQAVALQNGDVLQYDVTTNQWVPATLAGAAMFVDGRPVSDDYIIYVNTSNGGVVL